MWTMDQDETYFRIFDSEKRIAGYFDPQYGEHADDDEIELMLKKKHTIPGGFLVVPMIKFNLFDADLSIDVHTLKSRLEDVNRSFARWHNYILSKNPPFHVIRISHTDQDMLTMTLPIRFRKPIRLDKKDLAAELSFTMDTFQRLGFL